MTNYQTLAELSQEQEETRTIYKATYIIAMAAGRDAGNRSMRAGGRSEWDKTDLAAAAAEAARLIMIID